MKIKLIAPHEKNETHISSADTFKIQRLNLPLIAALTPEEHTVKIVDESFAQDVLDDNVDLVGITVMTDLVRRAYHLADYYRSKGVKVVFGGIHPTVLPEEALIHADAVVVGETEEVWPYVVSDAHSGKLKKLYRAAGKTKLKGLPRPRRDLYPSPMNKGYTPVAVGVETSRGCPYDCEFCSISHVMGRGYRMRPVKEVAEEIESIDSQYIFFVDDALGLKPTHMMELCREIAPLGRRWVGQGTISLAEDLELLRIMKRSGCIGLLIGFESVQKETQASMKKLKKNIGFSEAMLRFHGEGLFILGAFVFGFDHENKDIFEQTYEFIMSNRIDGVQLRLLVPFPGTRLYERLLHEKRLVAKDWWLKGYSPDKLLFHPKGMSAEALIKGFVQLNKEVYSYPSIFRRFFGVSPWKRTVLEDRIFIGFNLATRKRYLRYLAELGTGENAVNSASNIIE